MGSWRHHSRVPPSMSESLRSKPSFVCPRRRPGGLSGTLSPREQSRVGCKRADHTTRRVQIVGDEIVPLGRPRPTGPTKDDVSHLEAFNLLGARHSVLSD